MTDAVESGAGKGGGRFGLIQLAMLTIAALAVLAAVAMAMRSNNGLDISLDKEGKLKLTVQADDDFSKLITEAIAADPATVEAILSNNGYYNLTSPRLVDALARLDAAAAENKVVTEGMRQLLWDLNGPFQRPGTLSGADERLLGALEELEEVLRSSGHTSKLLAEIWQRSLERTSVFRPRSFNAEIVPVRGGAATDGGVVIFACAGNDLVGKQMTIWTANETASYSVTGQIADDVQRFDCGNAGSTLAELLAGEPLKLGLDPTTYAKLADPGGVIESLPITVTAKFQVHPKYLTAAVE